MGNAAVDDDAPLDLSRPYNGNHLRDADADLVRNCFNWRRIFESSIKVSERCRIVSSNGYAVEPFQW